VISGRPTAFPLDSLSRPRRAAFLLMLDYGHNNDLVGKHVAAGQRCVCRLFRLSERGRLKECQVKELVESLKVLAHPN
jgi:hypothetical protein